MNKSGVDKDLSEYFWNLKGFAIFFVICAHMAYISGINETQITILQSKILTFFGIFGVGMFFLISGYLFFYNNHDFSFFFRKKIKNLIIPWILSGTIIFIYVTARKGGMNISGYLNFLIGNGSYLYFLTNLMLFYIILFRVRNNTFWLAIMFSISIFSMTVSENAFFDNYNRYLIPTNWSMFFVLGLIIAKYDYMNSIIKFAGRYRKYILLVTIMIFFLYYLKNIAINYWGVDSLLLQILGLFLVFSISIDMKWDFLRSVGKNSLYIYLYHMLFCGLVRYMIQKNDISFLIIGPIIVLLLSLVLAFSINRLKSIF